MHIAVASAIIAVSFSFALQAQVDSVPDEGNSCNSWMKKKFQSLHYSYDVSTQTHDYSGNWDFDDDTDTDSLFFIGNGGAHLYFNLRLVLSSEKKARDFPFLLLDMPCVDSVSELENAGFYPPPISPQFVVYDFDADATDEIYLYLDKFSFNPSQEEWKKLGITSGYILLDYEEGDLVIKNFIGAGLKRY